MSATRASNRAGWQMPIGITEEHEALRATTREMLARHCPGESVRAAVDAPTPELPAYWSEAAALGWLGLHLPEESGGSAFGLAELAVVVEEIGRAVAPGPFVPTVHAAAVLAAEGGPVAKELLGGLADGSVPATVAIGATPIDAIATDDGVTITGTIRPVVAAGYGGVLLLPVTVAGSTSWCVVDEADVTVTPIESLDLGRRLSVIELAGVVVPSSRQLSVSDSLVYSLGAAVYAAEACGMASWCLDEAVRHAKERVQFGRPIGTFQAIKHKCADLLVLVEQMRAVSWDAARGDAASDDTQLAIAAAASIVFDGAVKAAEECIQVLGGIGFTWEHDAHLYLRRAVATRQLLGPTSTWRVAAAKLAMSGVRRAQNVELPEEAERHRAEVRGVPGLDRGPERRGPAQADRRRGLSGAALAEAMGSRGRARPSSSSSMRSSARPESGDRSSRSAAGWCRP